MNKQAYTTVIGGINIDIKGHSLHELIPKTSNPGKVYSSMGGVGRNIAHNLALLGIPVCLLGAVGGDNRGTRILNETKRAGVQVDCVRIVKEQHTGTYLSVLDQARDLAVAIADMDITHWVNAEYLDDHRELIQQSRFVILETNLDTDVLCYAIELCRSKQVPYLVEPVSVEKAKKIYDIPDPIDYITPNLSELEILVGDHITQLERLDNVCSSLKGRYQHLLVTLGAQGVFYYNQADNAGKLYTPPETKIVDANGAGDAFVAGLVCGLFHSYEIDYCIRLGLVAAHLTLQSQDTVNNHMSIDNCQLIIDNR